MLLSEFRPTYLTIEQRDDVVVAAFNVTHITDEENIEQLGQELFALVDQFACRKVIVSLGIVEYVTSSVLGKIISLHRRLHRCDGQLVICDIGETVSDILTTSNLIDYFRVSDSVESAMSNLQAN